ncbi:MAG TPA: sugar transferase [Acidimicrobiales bacterium]|nr:sugar transferase [Acidimicrobiales bacterium]
MAAQRSEEAIRFFVTSNQEGRELAEREFAASLPAVMLTSGFAAGRQLAPFRRLRRFAFVAMTSLMCGATAFVAVGLAHFFVDGYKHGKLFHLGYVFLSGLAALLVVLLTIRSRPDRARSADGYLEEWVEACREALIVGIALVVTAFFWRPALVKGSAFSRGTILLSIPLVALFLGITRSAVRDVLLRLRRRGHNLASVVVIGDGPSANSFMKSLEAQTGSGYRVIAHITDTPPDGDLGAVLEKLSKEVPIDEVVISSFAMAPEQIASIVSHHGMRGARLRAVPEMFGLPPSKVSIEAFGDFPLLTLFENPVRGPHWAVKRAVDLIGGSFCLAVAGLPMLVMALFVRITSPGPVLFRQERVGMDGKRFELLKFRSMTAGASDQVHREFMFQMLTGQDEAGTTAGGFFKLTDDPRITKVGKILRRYSLDELPQLLNVLKGDMSLVGPRPALAYEVDLYEDWQRRRLDVLPGMTGLWQVSGRSRLSPADMLRLDVHYAETWSLFKDVLIILKTVPAILRDDAR